MYKYCNQAAPVDLFQSLLWIGGIFLGINLSCCEGAVRKLMVGGQGTVLYIGLFFHYP